MRRAVLWDSSAVLALLDADDADHERASRVAHALARERRPCFVTSYVMAETHALLLRNLGRALALEWLLRGGIPVVHALPTEEERAKAILARDTDKDYGFCDALSFAVMELRGVRAAFSFDRHFRQYGKFEVLGRS